MWQRLLGKISIWCMCQSLILNALEQPEVFVHVLANQPTSDQPFAISPKSGQVHVVIVQQLTPKTHLHSHAHSHNKLLSSPQLLNENVSEVLSDLSNQHHPINVNENPINAHSASSSESSLVNKQLMQQVSSVYNALSATMAQCSTYAKDRAFGVLSAMRFHKWKTIAGVLIGTYGSVCARLYYLSCTLRNAGWWSQFRADLTLEQLFALDDGVLVNELVLAVNTRYGTHENPQIPLIAFLRDIERETAHAKAYRSWVLVLERVHCAGMFPINRVLLESLSSRIDRIAFLKSRIERFIVQRTITKPQ